MSRGHRLGDTLDDVAHPSDVVYAPGDRPVCWVQPEPDGPWHPGEVRAWYRYDDDWHANVGWVVDHLERFSRTLPAAQVRQVDSDDRHWADHPPTD